MSCQISIFCFLAVVSSPAAIIVNSGYIRTQSSNFGWGGFADFAATGDGIAYTGGFAMFTTFDCFGIPCLLGSHSLRANGLERDLFGSAGTLTQNGISSTAIVGGPNNATAMVTLSAGTVAVTGPGNYALPFTMSGGLAASAAPYAAPYYSTSMVGSGTVYFTMNPGPPGYAVASSGDIIWMFTPEPGTFGAAGGVLVLLIMAARRRRLKPANEAGLQTEP